MPVSESEIQVLSKAWHHLPANVALDSFASDAEQGLTAAAVNQAKEKYGSNELTQQASRPLWMLFLLQFNQPLLYILLATGAVKAALQDWVDAGVIWGVTVINAIIGFIQESKAESAIAALASSVETEATVIRDGQKQRVASPDLVPGDVVLLTSGDKVPADLRLLHTKSLQVNESALTGESVAVEKQADIDPLPEDASLGDRLNMAYAGSFATFGQGCGVVVATGNATETGRISKLMQEHSALVTPLTRKFDQLSRTLLYVILALAAFTFVAGQVHADDWTEPFDAAVALAVSAIPEGLPAVVTITLAIGVGRMASRNAIVRKLPAVETLGSATVICSDKTGTLTENQMTVQVVQSGGHHYALTGEGYAPEGELLGPEDETLSTPADLPVALRHCLMAGLLCNDSQLEYKERRWEVVGDPTEGALIVSAKKAGLTLDQLSPDYPRQDSIPFESEFQYMATLHQLPAGAGLSSGADPIPERIIYVKGSVESLMPRCAQTLAADGQLVPLEAEKVHREVEHFASQGMRVLAFGFKLTSQAQVDHDDLKTDLVFLGLQGMIDPPRPDAVSAVQACQTAGVQVKMITGDHKTTATAIAKRMGLGTLPSQADNPAESTLPVVAYTGQELGKMDEAELKRAAAEAVVFARVAPEQKLRLVEAMQFNGHIVAMTGDGVNDAPALKRADIGIAMGKSGTEVAKEAADMVLTDDNFASIEAAVEEGRTVYRNLMKAIAFILPVNGGESMTVLLSVLVGTALPISALQVLWLNMINSIAMTVPLAFEPKSSQVMQRPPLDPKASLLSKPLLWRIGLISVFNWILIFGMFLWALNTFGSGNAATNGADEAELAVARTMAIQALVAGRIIYLLSISQFWASLWLKLRGHAVKISDSTAIGLGIVAAVLLQILFSQWGLMNQLFDTAPLNWTQWGICLLAGLPIIVVVAIANRINPQT
jgi:cation-transporting ATPase F